jgi:hypothetical protein
MSKPSSSRQGVAAKQRKKRIDPELKAMSHKVKVAARKHDMSAEDLQAVGENVMVIMISTFLTGLFLLLVGLIFFWYSPYSLGDIWDFVFNATGHGTELVV